MVKVRNLLPYALGVPALGRVVEPDEVVEVDDDDLAARMVMQVGVWDTVPKTARREVLEAAVTAVEEVAGDGAAE